MGGLCLYLNHLGQEGEYVLVELRHVTAPHPAQQEQLPHPQVVDAAGHGAVQHHVHRGGGPAGDDLQPAADGRLHLLGGGDELLHLLGGGLDGAVAAQVGAHPQQVQVFQPLLHLQGGGGELLPVPEALPQVPQVHHENDFMALARPAGGLVGGPEDGNFALQADVRPLHQLVHLAEHGDADHHQGRADARLPQIPELLQPGGADAVQPRPVIDPGRLGQGTEALHDPGELDTRNLAALAERCQVFL